MSDSTPPTTHLPSLTDAGVAPAAVVPSLDGGKVLVCGDTHGDTEWVHRLVEVAAKNSCSRLLVCGDFGYWVHKADGRAFISDVDAALCAAGVELVFVDGNHEYHSTHPARSPRHRLGLQELETTVDVDGVGFARVANALRYASRGARWKWGSTRFAAFGGAASTDVELRKRFRDWWVEETPTVANLQRLGTDPVDVLVCHDAPAGYAVSQRPDRVDDPRSVRVRELVTDAVAQVTPKFVFHGHWHKRYDHVLTYRSHVEGLDRTALVVGLGANVDEDGEDTDLAGAAVVFDTDTGSVTEPQ